MSHQYNNQINPVRVDASKAPAEQRKALRRMERGAGKGDLPRNVWSDGFKNNFDNIDWTISTQPRRFCVNQLSIKKSVIFYG